MYRVGNILVLILQMRKLSHKNIKLPEVRKVVSGRVHIVRLQHLSYTPNNATINIFVYTHV